MKIKKAAQTIKSNIKNKYFDASHPYDWSTFWGSVFILAIGICFLIGMLYAMNPEQLNFG